MEKIKSLVTTKPGKMEWEMREKAILAKGEVLAVDIDPRSVLSAPGQALRGGFWPQNYCCP